MLYELRVYQCAPERKGDVLARFRKHTMALFQKHGVHVVGFWETIVGDTNQLIYITRYASWDDREVRWGACWKDPAWQMVREAEKASGRGPMVENVRTEILRATDFSPPV